MVPAAVFMDLVDGTIVSIALPRIRSDLHAGSAAAQDGLFTTDDSRPKHGFRQRAGSYGRSATAPRRRQFPRSEGTTR